MSSGTPRTGVVIATRDRRESLGRTLARLTALPESPAIAVVDDGSVDGTAEAVRRTHPEVRVVQLAQGAGAAARTIGVEALGTPLVAFSDDDSWWAPGALEHAAEIFDAYPRLGLLAARILVGPEQRLDSTCPMMRDSPLARCPDLPGPSVLGFLACGTIVRRSAFVSVGGFMPGFAVGGEEELLALDLAAAGWGLAYVDSVVAHHHPPPSDARTARARARIRNALWTAWLRRRLPAAARRTAGVAAMAVRTGEGGAVIEATRAAPRMRRERRPVSRELDRAVRVVERQASEASAGCGRSARRR